MSELINYGGDCRTALATPGFVVYVLGILAMFLLTQGALEVDQQWIISGAKQCSRHLN